MQIKNAKTDGVPMLAGARYRATHQASVDAVLGSGVRRVLSAGGRFYNRDRWPLRTFVVHFCGWVSQQRGRKAAPTLAEIEAIVVKANQEHVSNPHIVIAGTPEELPLPVALALLGGAYHEAWHTKYSRRADVTARQMKGVIDRVWGRVADWSRYGQSILEWSNIIEDIRIERLGCAEYPGTRTKMEDLQAFILEQEEDARKAAALKGAPAAALNRTQMVVSAVFRDVGLGYNTTRQRTALDAYRERNAEAVQFVLDGPLSDLLRKAIALGPDDIGCLPLAMEVLATILEASETPEESKDESEGGAGGDSKLACPNCGSPNVKLVPVSKIKAKLVCGHCGYTDEVDLKESKSKGGKGEKSEDKSDAGDSDDGSEGSDDGSEGEEKSKKSKKSKKEESEGDESEDGSGDSGDSEDSGDSGDDSEDGEGSGDSSEDGSEGSDDGSDGSEGSEDGSEDGEGASEGSEGSEDDEATTGKGAGGHKGSDEPAPAWDVVAAGFLEDVAGSNGLLDTSSALEEAFGDQKELEDARLKTGEAAYRPFNPSADTVAIVSASRKGQADDQVRAAGLLDSVKTECAYLRSRLRNIVRAVEQTNTEHGTQIGKGLSERMFVDDVAAIRSGRMPDRAYFDEDSQVDTSMAAAIVLDESGSMCGRLELATQAMLALSEPLDSLGCATLVLGFRDGSGNGMYPENGDASGCFRQEPVHIDVFKAFHESFRSVKWRFANTRAEGGTPMADGVQYALEGLSGRPEAHRVMFIITDGQPNYNHREVMARQIRLAREAGIYTVGVGIGSGAEYVKHLFDDYVFSTKLSDLPQQLVKKLNAILDFRGAKRGMRLRNTG